MDCICKRAIELCPSLDELHVTIPTFLEFNAPLLDGSYSLNTFSITVLEKMESHLSRMEMADLFTEVWRFVDRTHVQDVHVTVGYTGDTPIVHSRRGSAPSEEGLEGSIQRSLTLSGFSLMSTHFDPIKELLYTPKFLKIESLQLHNLLYSTKQPSAPFSDWIVVNDTLQTFCVDESTGLRSVHFVVGICPALRRASVTRSHNMDLMLLGPLPSLEEVYAGHLVFPSRGSHPSVLYPRVRILALCEFSVRGRIDWDRHPPQDALAIFPNLEKFIVDNRLVEFGGCGSAVNEAFRFFDTSVFKHGVVKEIQLLECEFSRPCTLVFNCPKLEKLVISDRRHRRNHLKKCTNKDEEEEEEDPVVQVVFDNNLVNGDVDVKIDFPHTIVCNNKSQVA
eukprot:CAMPEP_0184363156 /NCGR_PEP_ID=MMETSP1089-20130417/138334_1 /TAXON_ID=38269 ORGANISM="Gloeochaete wittrockiana, Strain SAG46.84" /NCGR_SAMPLE_ID=MMETSP1089 /ASSEMBLY_ACC=CAM_ASM_000445 /LENGTH=392 /DNA_ID=CAMNT_0026703531 /DNA_START=112 /DNA_END=1290 /DNA_ORIENTATION=-